MGFTQLRKRSSVALNTLSNVYIYIYILSEREIREEEMFLT